MRFLLLIACLLLVVVNAYNFDDHAVSLNDVGRLELSDEAYNRYLADLSSRLFNNRAYPARYDRYI